MKKAAIVLTLCVAMLGLASAAMAGEMKYILATGGTAGTYYPFGGAMAKIWNSKIPGMNVTAQATGASIENIRLMGKDDVELALVQSDNIDWAFNATGALQGEDHQDGGDRRPVPRDRPHRRESRQQGEDRSAISRD